MTFYSDCSIRKYQSQEQSIFVVPLTALLDPTLKYSPIVLAWHSSLLYFSYLTQKKRLNKQKITCKIGFSKK